MRNSYLTSVSLLLAVMMFNFNAHAIRKIYILYDPLHDFDKYKATGKGPYSLADQADTAFIRFSHMEDMGVPYGFSYYLKRTVPADTYYIYIDDFLVTEGFYGNGMKQGKWYHYLRDGTYGYAFYKNNKTYGVSESFDGDGNLLNLSWIDTNNVKQIYVSTEKHTNGEIRHNSFMVESTFIRNEYFDKNGRITKISHSNNDNPLYYSEDTFIDGKLNGYIVRTYKKGRFEKVYKYNRITRWRYFDFEKTCT